MNNSPLTENRQIASLEQYSFSDEAAQLIREEYPHLQMNYCDTFGDVWHAITKNNAIGMIPIENSSSSVVWQNLIRLITEERPLRIAANVLLQVKMCVGGAPDTTLENATHVYSHAQGHLQTGKFQESLPKGTQKIECSSTAKGSKMALAHGKGALVLGSEPAINAAGLNLLGKDVADLPGTQNVTKFFAVYSDGDEQLPDVERDYHAAIITPNEHMGVLADITNQMRNACMNLVSIHSRPVGVNQYAFFVEMERRGTPDEMETLDVWLQKSRSIKSVKWLGSWDDRLCNYPL